MPVDWAGTQNNHGNALWAHGSRTKVKAGTALLADAVAAYRAALEINARDDTPSTGQGHRGTSPSR
jgi:hypothetical protein